MKISTIKDLLKEKGLSDNDVGMAFAKVYICQNVVNGNPHQTFADELGVTRDDAKKICYWYQYSNHFMRFMFKSGQSLGYEQTLSKSLSQLVFLADKRDKEIQSLRTKVFSNK